MTSLQDIFKDMHTAQQMDTLLENTRETADLLSTEQDESSYYRLAVMETIENIASEVVQYGAEVRDILNGIHIATDLMPELLNELQAPDRSLMLEYLDLIESNTRALANVNNDEENLPATANQISSIMNATAMTLTESMEKQAALLGELVDNSNFERGLIEMDEDSFEPEVMDLDRNRNSRDRAQDGEGAMGFLGGIVSAWKKMPNAMKLVGKGAMKGAAVIGTAMFVKDLYDTFNNEERLRQITGKAEGALAGAEQSSAAIAGAIESFSGGLIDAKSTYDLIYSGVDLIQRGLDQIFDPEEGILGDFTTSVFNLVENGDWSKFGSDIVDSISNFPDMVVKKVTEWWDTFTSGILGKEVTDGIKSATDFAVNKVSSFGDWAIDGTKNLFGFNDEPSQGASNVVQKVSNMEAESGPRMVSSFAEAPVNRSAASKTEKLSKERFEDMLKIKEAPQVSTPIVQNTNTTNYSPIIREDNLGKQIQLLGI